ncbi:MAG: CHC2 zinc finger domain-containing protein [Bacteroidota bacterium]
MNPFTKQQLFQVRNEIDIDWLINEKLHLERQFNSIWRFQCPVCQQFNTATQKKNNLARCFSCQKNFNTIDLMIYSKKMDFVPGVQFLLSLLEKKSISNGSAHNLSIEKKAIKNQDRKAGFQAIEKMKQIIR